MYTSCFLGIPLPKQYQEQFQSIQHEVTVLDPTIQTVQPTTPHITVFYFNKQSQDKLSKIKKLIEPHIDMLKEIILTINGINYFSANHPKVLFLSVSYPEVLTQFHTILSRDLKQFADVDEQQSFHPHMTIGRINSVSNFIKVKSQVKNQLSRIHWQFPLQELGLYGVDSNASPQKQKKIFSLFLP